MKDPNNYINIYNLFKDMVASRTDYIAFHPDQSIIRNGRLTTGYPFSPDNYTIENGRVKFDPYRDRGDEIYMLPGPEINQIINKNLREFVRWDGPCPVNVITTDITDPDYAPPGTIVTWYDARDRIQYWRSDYQRTLFNPDMSKMFANSDIWYAEFNASHATNMDRIFEGCSHLERAYIDGLCQNISFTDSPNLYDHSLYYTMTYADEVDDKNIDITGCDVANRLSGSDSRVLSFMFKGWVFIPEIETNAYIDFFFLKNNESQTFLDLDLDILYSGKCTIKNMNTNTVVQPNDSIDISSIPVQEEICIRINCFRIQSVDYKFDGLGLIAIDVRGQSLSYIRRKQTYNDTGLLYFYMTDSTLEYAEYLFRDYTELVQANVNISNVYFATGMFYNCTKLEHVEIYSDDFNRGINTVNMFKNCTSLIDVFINDTCRFGSADYMFSGCTNLVSIIGLMNMDLMSTYRLFENCYSLEHVEMDKLRSSLDLSACTHISYDTVVNIIKRAYKGLTSEKTIDITGCDIVDQLNKYDPFIIVARDAKWKILPELDPVYIDFVVNEVPKLESVDFTFEIKSFRDSVYTPIPLEGFDVICDNPSIQITKTKMTSKIFLFNIANVSSTENINDLKIKLIPLSGNIIEIQYTINGNTLKGIETNRGGDIERIYDSANTTYTMSSTIEYFRWKGNLIFIKYAFMKCKKLKEIVIDSNINGDWTDAFNGCESLEVLQLNPGIHVYNMFRTFASCFKLTSIPDIDTSTCTIMEMAFYMCLALPTIPLLNTSSVYNMNDAFRDCDSIVTFPLLDTSNVQYMRAMFDGCINLESVPLLNTSKATQMHFMFSHCFKLKTIPEFNLSKVTDTSYMFQACRSLEEVSLDMGNINMTEGMFNGTESLRNCYLRNLKKSIDFSSSPLLRAESIRYIMDNVKNVTTNEIINITGCIGYDELTHDDIEVLNAINKGWNIHPSVRVANMTTGTVFNNAFNKSATSFVISSMAPTGTATDISLEQDGTILTWYDSGLKIQYLYTPYKKIILNPDSSKLFYNCLNLTSLDVSSFDTSKVTNMASMFYNCSNLTSLNVSGFDTSNVTNMMYIFYYCRNLTSLDLSSFNTSNVTSMYGMFYNCSNLTSLNVLGFDTSNVIEMRAMFQSCSKLTTLNVSSFNTSKVTAMNNMFSSCSALTTLDLSNFNTSNVTYMTSMFSGCSKLSSLNVSSFDTSNVMGMYYMFAGCSVLSNNLLNFDTSKVTDMGYMFSNCQAYTSLDLSHFNTSSVTDMRGMFAGCVGLTSLNILGFNTSKVFYMNNMFYNCRNLTQLILFTFDTSRVVDMGEMFYDCQKIELLDISSFNTSKVTKMNGMFRNTSSLTTNGIIYNNSTFVNISLHDSHVMSNDSDNYTYQMYYNSGANKPLWTNGVFSSDGTFIKRPMLYHSFNEIVNINAKSIKWSNDTPPEDAINADYYETGIIKTWYDESSYTQYLYSYSSLGELTYLPDTINLFKGLTNIIFIDMHNFALGTYNTSMYGMFEDCTSLQSIDLSGLDTSNITDMSWMFGYCNALTSINISGLNTSKVTSMNSMFNSCKSLEQLSLPFDTSKVTNMSSMFYMCENLRYLNISSFDTSNVQYMTWMFGYCSQLTSLDLSNFNTSNVVKMSYMFYYSDKLTSINVSSFNTSKVTEMESIFSLCYSLTTLNVSNFDTSKVISMKNMFQSCSKLTSINVSNFNTSKVTNMYGMFSSCSAITTLNVSSFNTANVTDMSYMFSGCKITSLSLINFDTSKVTKMENMFNNCSNLTLLNLFNFNTSSVTTMNRMFNSCSSLTTLNISGFDTGNVADMSYMFQSCSQLTSINISSFNTSKVTNMRYMFNECSNLTTLNLLNFNTSSVTNMSYMFSNCSKLTSIDLSSFNTTNVTDMSYMFRNCSNLTTLNLLNFNTSKVTSMSYMFQNCTLLQTISELDLVAASSVTNIVSGMSNLRSCSFKNLKQSIVFTYCPLLDAISIKYMLNNVQVVTSKTFNITGCAGYNEIVLPEAAVQNALSKGWTIVPTPALSPP